jgi:hypothetical protein
MDEELQQRLENLENSTAALLIAHSEVREKLDAREKQISEMLEFFNTAKTGIVIAVSIGKFVKWASTMSIAAGAIWAIIYAWKTGQPPTISKP